MQCIEIYAQSIQEKRMSIKDKTIHTRYIISSPNMIQYSDGETQALMSFNYLRVCSLYWRSDVSRV